MKLEDFTIHISMYGYLIKYKGEPIGVIPLPSGKPLNWQQGKAALREHKKQAEEQVNQLIAGCGEERFKEAIRKIELRGVLDGIN